MAVAQALRRTLWILPLAVSAACGARSDLGALAPGADAGVTNASSAVVDASSAVADRRLDEGAAPPRSKCNFDSPDDPAAPVLVAVTDNRLFLIRADGSMSLLHQFSRPPDAPDARVSTTGVSATVQGGYIAVDARDTAFIGPALVDWQQWDELALLQLDGTFLWHRSLWSDNLGPSHSRSISLLLGREGVMAVSADQHFLVWPDGREYPLGNRTPLVEPFAGPLLAIREPTTQVGWWHPGASSVVPLRRPARLVPEPFRVANRLVYASDADGGTVLVSERSDAEHDFVSTDLGKGIMDRAPTGWILISIGAEFVRFNAVTGEVSRALLQLPRGFRPLGGTPASMFIDADGSFLAPLRNDYTAGLYRSPDGTSWSLVGKTLGQVESIQVTVANGTYVIEAKGTNDFFVPMEVWTVPAPRGEEPELLQASTQFVRPETQTSVSVQERPTTFAISEDGHCIASSHETTSTVWNITRGQSWLIGAPGPFRRFGWIE